jgi:uncharacterized membrane protein YhhN
MMNELPIFVCVVAVVGLLAAEKSGSRWGIWLAKPVAAGAYVWAALTWGALETSYGRWVLLGLVLCFWGDVLLIPKNRRSWFRAGIIAFLSGHLAYIAAFLRLPTGKVGLLVGIFLAAALAWFVMSWLGPKLPAGFRRLVVIYIAVICSMVVVGCGAADGSGVWSIALGSSLFAISDVSVARDRFVAKAFANRAWGLPMYFTAQLILASTVAG